MTFFANSGISWPNLHTITSDAGSKTLDAASDLLEILAALEGDTDKDLQTIKNNASRKLDKAITLYKKILDDVDDVPLAPLSTAEYELASIEHFPPFPIYPPYTRDGYLGSPRQLYSEIIVRLQTLSSRLTDFDVAKPKEQLAYQAFQLMHDWERLAILARIIAVANRRPRKG